MNVAFPNLEDFSVDAALQFEGAASDVNKASRKRAFDEGYRDGWNDAFTEARNEEERAQSSIASALQELSFTYFEARQHIMGSVKPLLDEMLMSVLPKAASASLIPLLEEELTSLLDKVEPPIRMLVAPQNLDQLSEMVANHTSIPIEIEAEDTLTDKQVRICYSSGFTALNTDLVIRRIQSSLSSFFETTDERSKLNA